MNIPVILNGNKIILEAQTDEPLMSVLQKKGCSSVKCGCNEGSCGSCTVLLEDKPIPSCKIPVGIVRDEKIHLSVCEKVIGTAKQFGFEKIQLTTAPLNKDKNIEFLILFDKV